MLEYNKEYKVKGYIGRWTVIDDYKKWVLLEHSTYGDETCYLVAEKEAPIIMKKYKIASTDEVIELPEVQEIVAETYDDIMTALDDEGIEHEDIRDDAPIQDDHYLNLKAYLEVEKKTAEDWLNYIENEPHSLNDEEYEQYLKDLKSLFENKEGEVAERAKKLYSLEMEGLEHEEGDMFGRISWESDADEHNSHTSDSNRSSVTEQGYPIVATYKDREGRLYVIAQRKDDFCIGAGYNVSDGTWAQGYYGYTSQEEAEKALETEYPTKIFVEANAGNTFLNTTANGYKILALYKDSKYNDIYAIFERDMSWGKDYGIAYGYDIYDGTWRQGAYDFNSFEEADKTLTERFGSRLTLADSTEDLSKDYEIISVDELLSNTDVGGEYGKDTDIWIRILRNAAKQLGVNDYNQLTVVKTNTSTDLWWMLEIEGDRMKRLLHGVPVVADDVENGQAYLYFKSEEDAKSLINRVAELQETLNDAACAVARDLAPEKEAEKEALRTKIGEGKATQEEKLKFLDLYWESINEWIENNKKEEEMLKSQQVDVGDAEEWTNGIFEFPNGDYLSVERQGEHIVAGHATNTGLMKEYSVDIEEGDSIDKALQQLWDLIVELHPEYLESEVKDSAEKTPREIADYIVDFALDVSRDSEFIMYFDEFGNEAAIREIAPEILKEISMRPEVIEAHLFSDGFTIVLDAPEQDYDFKDSNSRVDRLMAKADEVLSERKHTQWKKEVDSKRSKVWCDLDENLTKKERESLTFELLNALKEIDESVYIICQKDEDKTFVEIVFTNPTIKDGVNVPHYSLDEEEIFKVFEEHGVPVIDWKKQVRGLVQENLTSRVTSDVLLVTVPRNVEKELYENLVDELGAIYDVSAEAKNEDQIRLIIQNEISR